MIEEGAPRSLKERQRLERQELILQAAEQVFAEKGYRDASMDEIAARVGIGTATIYLHYRSKEELMIAAVIERDLQKVIYRVREINQAQGRAVEKLIAIFHYLATSDFFRRRVHLFYSIGNSPEMLEVLDIHHERMRGGAQALFAELDAVLEQGKAEGDIQAGQSNGAMSRALIGLVRSHSTMDSLLFAPEASLDAILQIFLQGIIIRTE
jgi:TetR/AcrR family transcriptional regulator, fatty acid metabolism regulator protein